MPNPTARLERTLLVLFVASGFAGLVYQAIWSHYLGLVLGHAAYAQTLVLAIFMGGMAVGAWLVSARGGRWTGLIRAYAIVELIIGATALAFHPMFLGYMSLSQDTVLPALQGESAIRAWQWGTAALMIAPQSVLLGMTFPLMSGGYLRVAPQQDGQILGGLYFTNSIGAAAGALVATFLLLPWIGMPGAIVVAGVVNVLVGLLAWRVAAGAVPVERSTPTVAEAVAPPADPGALRGLSRFILFGAGITGASSFVYEIGWIRMLNQALGATVHSFELMLSAFILGLAFGGLWVRRRSARIVDPVFAAGLAQVLMGLAALISLPLFANSFAWVGWLMSVLPKTDAGYGFYSLGSASIALAIMFPAAFFAGMTLPLFTMVLLRKGAGERSIGRVYAANTLGAIVGVMLAVHVLIPMLGLRLAVTVAALADILLGLALLRGFAAEFRPRPYFSALAATLVVCVVSLLFGAPDPRAQASGVFRHGRALLDEGMEVEFLRDGKTATVSYYIDRRIGYGIIATNGKPDASIQLNPALEPTDDEYTMVMAASLPLALHPKPERVAIIGWGSGLTTHTMLGSSAPTSVDTIEIEQSMVMGASHFGKAVARGYTDGRSNLRIDDARTYFSAGAKRYDVIVSEPSNPWVSGVSSLFTREFYDFLGRHLDEGGLLVQWLQSYELNDALFYSMVAALIDEYPYVEAYLTNSADVIFVASHSPIGEFDLSRLQDAPLHRDLVRTGLDSRGDHEVRHFADRKVLLALVELFGAKPHTDYLPSVALGAPRSRFKGEAVRSINTLMGVGMPVLEMTGGRVPVPVAEGVHAPKGSQGAMDHSNAVLVRELLLGTGPGKGLDDELLKRIAKLRDPATPLQEWLEAAAVAADYSVGYLTPEDLQGVWIDPVWAGERARDPQAAALLQAYAAASRRDAAAMSRSGRAGLAALPADRVPGLVRDHLLVIAMLGAIGEGDSHRARALEDELGASVRVSNNYYGLARSYLSAWAAVDARRKR
jgi:predicted membrane-bound spermidine synthase